MVNEVFKLSDMAKARNGPVTVHGRGTPGLRFGTGGDPPWVLRLRGDPVQIEARGDPPEIESRGDPPEINCARNGPNLEWLVFSRIGFRIGPHRKGMPGWERASPAPSRGGVKEDINEDSGWRIENSAEIEFKNIQ